MMLTDAQWASVELLLPGKPGDVGRPAIDNRRSLEGMLWVLRTGAQWRDLPPEFGKWGTVYQRFRRWTAAGIFQRLFESTKGHLDMRSVQVDGTYVKAHQHSAGAPKGVARPTSPGRRRPSGGAVAGSLRSWLCSRMPSAVWPTSPLFPGTPAR